MDQQRKMNLRQTEDERCLGDMGTSTCLHPFKECTININSSLAGNINLKILEEMKIIIPEGRFLFKIKRCSKSMKSIISLEMLTLMSRKRQ